MLCTDEERYTSTDELDLIEQHFGDIVEFMVTHGYSIKELEFLEKDEWRGQEIDESQATPRFCEFIFEYAILDKKNDIQKAEWIQLYGVEEVPNINSEFSGMHFVMRRKSDEEKASCNAFAKNVRRLTKRKKIWFRQTVPGLTKRFVFAAEPSITYNGTDEHSDMKISLTPKEVKGWI